jgi:hypothetical protein
MRIARRPATLRRLLLGAALVWLSILGGAFWLHRRPPVADVILTPVPGWQMQVWFGTKTVITHATNRQASPPAPIVVVFYQTPYTGIRLLARLTLPAWPLALSAGLFAALLLVAARHAGAWTSPAARARSTTGGVDRR